MIWNMTTICKETNKTAYETMLNKPPYLAKLYPFGSRCYVYNTDRLRKKLDDRGIPARLVGYEEQGRGYRV